MAAIYAWQQTINNRGALGRHRAINIYNRVFYSLIMHRRYKNMSNFQQSPPKISHLLLKIIFGSNGLIFGNIWLSKNKCQNEAYF
jgi:hypothetical protein